VARRLPSGAVGIDGTAADLGLTRRTLQRRLADCGVLFSDLIDITRRDIAMRRLLEGCNNLKALSADLGYSDPSHFTRTFRRWTGMAPSDYRAPAFSQAL
jgi:AraC-like DNA-binding protein